MANSSSPIAYLTGEYPAASHPFMRREIAALRAEGRNVITCALTPGKTDASEAAETFYVTRAATSPATFFKALGFGFSRIDRLWRAFRLAIKTSAPGPTALFYQMSYLIRALVLARHLTDKGVYHLHNHFADASCSVAMLTSELTGIPFSLTMHGPSVFFEPNHWRLDEKIARAKFTACISSFCRSQGMIFADQAHWPKMKIVRSGVTPNLYDRENRTSGHNLIFIGDLRAVKGVAVLLHALVEIKDQVPDVHLTLIGEGEERSMLERLAQDLGLGSAVTFAGSKTEGEITEALKTADLFVLPSFAEGMPEGVIEAMASGLPVVASRIAGMSEVIGDGRGGELVPPGSEQSLIMVISTLLNDPEMRQKMGQEARATVETMFDSTREAAKIGALIDGSVTNGPMTDGRVA